MVSDLLADLARLEGVPSAVAAARDAVDAVLRDRGLRQVGAQQGAAARLAGARASAELTEDPERWLPGAVRLAVELPGLAAVIRVSPGQALARAHALVGRGQLPDEELGRVRAEADVSRRLAGLRSLLTEPTAAPGVVVAAIAHAEVATVAPFGSADGLVARGVEHMVLVATGVDPLAVLAVEAGHLALRTSYESSLRGYADGGVTGVRDWLLHCTAAVAAAANASPLAVPGRVADSRPG